MTIKHDFCLLVDYLQIQEKIIVNQGITPGADF